MKKFFSLITFFVITICFIAYIIIDREIRYPIKYFDLVNSLSISYRVDSALVFAIIKTESNFKSDAISSAGAVGLMQLLPSTALYIADLIDYDKEIDLTDAASNIELGVAYFSYLFAKFDNLKYSICAYNAGEGRVREWIKNGQINNIPYKETREYCEKVMFAYNIYQNMLL